MMEIPAFELPLGSGDPVPALAPAPGVAPDGPGRPGRPHLVVVRTRAAAPGEATGDIVLVTRFWHPRDQRWSENSFESLEHALRLFVDESGWVLIQQQMLAGPTDHELIFEGRRVDFTGPTTEEILRDVGMAPQED